MQNDKIWNKVLDDIRDQVSTVNYRGWFLPTSLHQLTEETITLSVPSAFVKSQLIARYHQLIEKSITKVTGKTLTIAYVIDASKEHKKNLNHWRRSFLPSLNHPLKPHWLSLTQNTP